MDPTPEPAKMKAGCSPAFLYKEFRNEYSSFGGARAQFSDCCGDAFQTTPPQGSGGRLNTVRASSTLAPTGAVLLEIARGHDGRNNGRLGLSVRRASQRCNVARGTAQRALVELQDRGFVDCMTKGAFSRKAPHATEWRLTWWSCDVTGELASKNS